MLYRNPNLYLQATARPPNGSRYTRLRPLPIQQEYLGELIGFFRD